MRIKKKLFGILFSFILVLGMSITAFAEEKDISAGTIYSEGDTIVLGEDKWVITDDNGDQPTKISANDYNISKPNYSSNKGQFEFSNLFGEGKTLSLGHDQNLTGNETIAGIKCFDGTGDETDPYKFRLVIAYPLQIGDVQVTSENKENVLDNETATVSYTPADTETPASLTLNGADIYGKLIDYNGIIVLKPAICATDKDLTIVAKGTNTVTGPAISKNDTIYGIDSSAGVYVKNGSLTVTGDGTLTAKGGDAEKNNEATVDFGSSVGVFAKNDVTVKGTLIAKGGTAEKNLGISSNGNITVETGGTLTATCDMAGETDVSGGVSADGNVTVEEGGILTATGGTVTNGLSYGVQGRVTVNGKLTATGGKAYYSVGVQGSVTVNGKLTATGGEVTGTSYGVLASDVIVEKNGMLEAKGGTVTGADSGNDSIGVSGNVTVRGTLIARGSKARYNSYGVFSEGNITVEEGGKLTATSDEAENNSCGVRAYDVVTINGTLEATAGETRSFNSAGVYARGIATDSIRTVTVGKNAVLNATGEDNAIYGIVKNSVAGTGWTNTEGTEGEAAIKVSTEGQTLDYKKVQFPENKKPATVITVPTGKTLTYNGKTQTGVTSGTGYTLSGTTSATNAGSYKATATLKNGYIWSDKTTAAKTIGWKIKKAEKKIKIPTVKKLTYNSKSQTALKSGDHYTVSGTTKAKKAGTYNATVKLKTDANYTFKWSDGKTGAKTIKWTIAKAANPLKIKAKTATVLYKKLKKEKQNVAVSKVINFQKKGQGKMSYTKKSGNGKITINKNSGKVTVKKGLDKGTYKVTVSVKAKGNDNYKASSVKKVTFKIIVK